MFAQGHHRTCAASRVPASAHLQKLQQKYVAVVPAHKASALRQVTTVPRARSGRTCSVSSRNFTVTCSATDSDKPAVQGPR